MTLLAARDSAVRACGANRLAQVSGQPPEGDCCTAFTPVTCSACLVCHYIEVHITSAVCVTALLICSAVKLHIAWLFGSCMPATCPPCMRCIASPVAHMHPHSPSLSAHQFPCRRGGAYKALSTLLRHKLVHHDGAKCEWPLMCSFSR